MKKSSNPAQPVALKHVPERTCIACHEVMPKHQLVRLVRSPLGVVEVDTLGRKPGRGAYLCYSPACWNKGVNKGKLEHALRGKIDAENRAKLIEFGMAVGGAETAPARTGEVN